MGRKVMAVLLLIIAASTMSWAGTPTPSATPDTVVSEGITLTVDKDYSWEASVVTPGLKFGTPEWKQARLSCIAYCDQVKVAQEAAHAGDWAKAEMLAPTYVMKAFYGLNHLRQLMGGKLEGGSWSKYAVKPGDDPEHPLYGGTNIADVAVQWYKVDGYVNAALNDDRTVDGKGHDVDTVETYLQGYRTGLLSEVVK